MASSASSSMEEHRYAILMETSGAEYESWYYFIRYEGNEEALHDLHAQFETIDFCIIDDLSTFDLELKFLVSEKTAREMCKVDLNSQSFHRKFDGKLQMIDFGFSRKDDDEDRIEKVNNMIALGNIDRFIEAEDPCDSDYSAQSESEPESDSDHDRPATPEPYRPSYPSDRKTSSSSKEEQTSKERTKDEERPKDDRSSKDRSKEEERVKDRSKDEERTKDRSKDEERVKDRSKDEERPKDRSKESSDKKDRSKDDKERKRHR